MKQILLIAVASVLFFSCDKAPTEKNEEYVSNKSVQVEETSDASIKKPLEIDTTGVAKKLQDTINRTEIKFDAVFHDLGTIKKGNKGSHYFTFVNTGDKPLIISGVKPACGCTAPVYPHQPIAPNGKDSILLEFNSANFNGQVEKTATVNGNLKEPVVLRFKANIVE